MKPVNRKEIFMTALAKGEEVGIEPVTREEMLLAEQAKREAGSSGGGGGGEKKDYSLRHCDQRKYGESDPQCHIRRSP